MDPSEVEPGTALPETSIFVYQKYRGAAAYSAAVSVGALMAIVGFTAGMRTSTLALVVFLAGCLVVVGSILKLAMAIGDRKPVLVLAPREFIDARRPAYDQAVRWSAIREMRVVHTFADGAAPQCTATLYLTKSQQSEAWRTHLSGLDQPATTLVEMMQQRIAAAEPVDEGTPQRAGLD